MKSVCFNLFYGGIKAQKVETTARSFSVLLFITNRPDTYQYICIYSLAKAPKY